jgi:hypothetical protein
LGAQATGITTDVGASVPMLVSLVMRPVSNLIHRGTSLIVQGQNGLPAAASLVEIGEKSRFFRKFRLPEERSDVCLGSFLQSNEMILQ